MQKTLVAIGLSITVAGLSIACGGEEDPEDNAIDHEPAALEDVWALGGQCDTGDDVRTMRVLLGNDDKYVKSGDPTASDEHWALSTLVEADVQFGESLFFPYGDAPCEEDDADPRCNATATLSASGDPRFSGQTSDSQALAVAISNSGQWRGLLPAQVGQLFPVDENGDIDGESDLGALSERGVDPAGLRFSALQQLGEEWEQLAQTVSDSGRAAHVGLWSFEDSGATVASRVAETGTDPTAMWTDNATVFSQAVDALSDDSPEATRAHVYSSLITLMDIAFIDTAEGADADQRSILLIVSGPDELQRADTTVQNVINKARSLDVAISILQVDPALDQDLLRDDFYYYDEQPGCSDDLDCKNFEECRNVELYSWGAAGGIDHPEDPDATYCMPARDETGRLGPITEYQQLACETGGSFVYSPSVDSNLMHEQMGKIPWATEAAWDLDFTVDEPALDTNRSYSLQTELSVGTATTDLQSLLFGPTP